MPNNIFIYLFYTELLLLWRKAHEWLYPIGFFLIVICLFPLAFTPDPLFLQKYVPGCVWMAALLAGFLSVENIFNSDMEDGFVEQLLISNVPLSGVVLVKLLAVWLMAELPLILLTPLIGILFNLSFAVVVALALSLLAGSFILIFIGALCVTLGMGLRQQGAMLGLLILPLVTPVLIFGVSIVQHAQMNLSYAGPLAMLAGLTCLALTCMPFVIAATLRIGIE